MKRFLSLGLATASVALAFVAAACSPDDELIPIEPGGGGTPGGADDTGRDSQIAVSVDDPPTGTTAKNTYQYQDGVVVADAAFVGAVTVADNLLTIPTAGHEAQLAQLTPGVVFVGDRRADMADQNPIGFLRQVTGVRTDGANSLIDTTPATMKQLFAEADFGGGGDPSYDGLQPQSGGSLQLLDTGSAGTSFSLAMNLGELTFTGGANKLKYSGAFSLSVQPRVNFKYEERSFWRSPNVEIDMQVAFRRLFAACLKAEFKGGGVSSTEKASKTIPLPDIRLPIPVPLPLVVTAKFKSEATCELTPTGAFGYATQIENDSRLRVRFGIQDGETFRGADWPDTPNTNRFEVLLSGGVKAECKVSMRAGVYFYDRVGGFIELAPGAKAEVAGYGKYTQGGGVEGQICAGAEIKVQLNAGLEADVWVAKYERKWNLIERKYPIPGFPTPACAGTARNADGCSGRNDGTYCSLQSANAAYTCRAGLTVAGVAPCPTAQFCKTTSNGQAEMEGAGLKCATTEPPTKPLDLSFCPDGNAR